MQIKLFELSLEKLENGAVFLPIPFPIWMGTWGRNVANRIHLDQLLQNFHLFSSVFLHLLSLYSAFCPSLAIKNRGTYAALLSKFCPVTATSSYLPSVSFLQFGDTSWFPLTVQKAHTAGCSIDATHLVPVVWSFTFTEHLFSPFLSFSIFDFSLFETADFRWISLSLYISTPLRFPFIGLSLIAYPLPSPNYSFHIFFFAHFLFRKLVMTKLEPFYIFHV